MKNAARHGITKAVLPSPLGISGRGFPLERGHFQRNRAKVDASPHEILTKHVRCRLCLREANARYLERRERAAYLARREQAAAKRRPRALSSATYWRRVWAGYGVAT